MARRTARAKLADAHEQSRQLRNQLYAAEQGNLPLLAELQGLRNELLRTQRKLADAETLVVAYRGALDGLVKALYQTMEVASGKMAVDGRLPIP